MHNPARPEPVVPAKLPRRTILGAIPALFLVAACSKQSRAGDGDWTKSGSSPDKIDHSLWDTILANFGRQSPDGINRIDYAGIKQKAAGELDRYVKSLEMMPIADFPRDEQFAFWVNLYNAATVRVITDNYPLKSIRDIGLLGQGPWKDKILMVGGKELSLDDIEHGILRPVWKDVRIHYAVNCASLGCPNLALKAWRAEGLEAMLDQAAAAYVNHPRGFSRKDGQLIASSIYEWYQDDWGADSDVLVHAKKYATTETLKIISGSNSIDSYDYSWALNSI